MKVFENMRLATKLGMAFSVLLLLSACIGIGGIIGLGAVNNTAATLSSDWMPSMRVIQDIKSQVARIRTRELQYIISSDIAEMDKYDKVIAADLVDLGKMQDAFVKQVDTAEEKQLYADFVAMWAKYLDEDKKIRAAMRAGDETLAKQLIRGDSNKLIVSLRGQIDKLVTLYGDGGNAAAAAGAQTYQTARSWIIGLIVLSIALGAIAAVTITRWLTGTLGGEPAYAVTIAGRIAAGELSTPIDTRPDDRRSLLFAMKSMRDSLASIVAEVRNGTDTINSAATEIAAGNDDLSLRTEQQAGSLEETAASMEELTATVRQNSANAEAANTLALNASAIAQKGNAVVSKVVSTMGNIDQSAKKIADIISVIDSIAFQTNILALNAAVEAARAGEQGRGFAVVATEVRNLAHRSATAAKEIGVLINDSVNEVETGSKLVGEAGATMEEVLASVRQVNEIMTEISAASREQSAGIEQVNKAITEMDQVTQQNATLVEEATMASRSMQDQAAALQELVAVFQLDASRKAALPVPKPAVKPRLALAAKAPALRRAA
jgi:methyl-accepting chemotaxis protein